MKTFSLTSGLTVPRGVPVVLLFALTALIFILASKIEDGWLVQAVMATSLLLLACLLPRLHEEEKDRSQAIRFNTALSVSRMALWVHNFKKDSIEWTDSIDGIAGYPQGGFPRTSQGWLGVIHPEDMPYVGSALESSRREGLQYAVEYRLQNQNGAFMWVSDTGDVPIKGESGGVMHGAIRDITDQKRLTDKSIQLEAQLRQAQKSEAIGTLAGGIGMTSTTF